MFEKYLLNMPALFEPFTVLESAGILLTALIVMVLITIAHELGHLLPSRYFTSTGKFEFFPFRDKPGVMKWFVVASCHIPDEIADNTPKGKMALIILGGPVVDVAVSALAVFIGNAIHNGLGIAFVFGGGFRLLFFVVNLMPFGPTDGGQLRRLLCTR